MYKYFLTLRYMLSKFLPHLSSLGVALCVFLSLTVISLFSGFLDKLETSARGLFGEIIIEAPGANGMPDYDAFIQSVTDAKTGVAEVAAAEPFIISYGMLRLKGDSTFRQYVQVAGIRLPGREKVSSFAEGLKVQRGVNAPTFNPTAKQTVAAIKAEQKIMADAILKDVPQLTKLLTAKEREEIRKDPGMAVRLFLRKELTLTAAQSRFREECYHASTLLLGARRRLAAQDRVLPMIAAAQKALDEAIANKASVTEIDDRRENLEDLQDAYEVVPDEYSVIIGSEIPSLTFPSPSGEMIRRIGPGHQMTLYVFPAGRNPSKADFSPEIRMFKITDANESGVFSIDKLFIYVPFETLQTLSYMDANPTSSVPTRARCSQIHMRVSGDGSEEHLQAVAAKVRETLAKFMQSHPGMAAAKPTVQTWRERQAQVLQPLQQQRMLAIFALILISLVAVVLIFAILYMMTVQKTREIGLLKALGASNSGVAGLFFIFGSTIGVAGSAIGVGLAYLVVTNINAVQSALGLQVFTRRTHLFNEIPNTMDWNAAIWVVGGAILAGLLGALIPALRAAWKQPVAALRYE
ncbi:MAG: ABC transporter permease [Phycisphaerales bacterium]|jgi:lipoprotein-releasing system permease protein|nr:ABC transporter permease [Phycisphaerales bacterium]